VQQKKIGANHPQKGICAIKKNPCEPFAKKISATEEKNKIA
jgi:hypothetical protein